MPFSNFISRFIKNTNEQNGIAIRILLIKAFIGIVACIRAG